MLSFYWLICLYSITNDAHAWFGIKESFPENDLKEATLIPNVTTQIVPIFLENRSGDIWKQINVTTNSSDFVMPVITPSGPPLPMPPDWKDPETVLKMWWEEVDTIQQRDAEYTESQNTVNYLPISIKETDSSTPLMCGDYLLSEGESAVLTSPYYPENYPGRFRCKWSFLRSEGTGGFTVECTDIHLIGKAYLLIDGNRYDKTSIGSENIFYESSLPLLNMYFASRRRSRSRGFTCSITAGMFTTPEESATSTTFIPSTTIATTEESTSIAPTTTISSTTTATTTTTTATTTTTSTTTTTPLTTTPPLSFPDCGLVNRAEKRIVNGQEATLHEYPWQTYLLIKWSDGKNQLCGGSLISEQWVLTAGHCVMRPKSDGSNWIPEVKVILGAHRRSNPTGDGGIEYTASDVIIHPANSFSHDLALIKIPVPASLSDSIYPVCLPDHRMLSKNFTGVVVAVSGWGKTETGKLSENLRELARYAIEPAICQKVFGSYITDHHFCSSGADVKHICLGDSGGPVITFEHGRFFLAGVISFVATADCKGEFPDGHTSVIHFATWIEETTGIAIY